MRARVRVQLTCATVGVINFGTMRTDETPILAMDFLNLLSPSSDTISTVANWTTEVRSGTDAGHASLISGIASTSGTKSRQALTGTGRTAGTTYWLFASMTSAAGQTFVGVGYIKVIDVED